MSEVIENDVAFLAGVRKARERQSVLKMKFIDLRGRSPSAPIFVFEGDDDKIIYGRWIGRLKPSLKYEAFVCSGKKRVASLQSMLIRDLGSLGENTFLFIDRDFDDDRDFISNDSLFMTDRYSAENYLITKEVLDTLLRDELSCHEHPAIRDRIIELFNGCYERFLDHTEEFNRRLFIARRKDFVINGSLPEKIAGYAAVELEDIKPASKLPEEAIIVDDGELDAQERAALLMEFATLDRRHRYRGKNALLFFTSWLSLVCDELAKKEQSVFGGPPGTSRLRREELCLGAFASKSAMPLALPAFLDRVAA